MKRQHSSHPNRLVRLLGVLAVLGATIVSGVYPPAIAAQEDGVLDLAAMVLQPDDLVAEGIEAHGIANAILTNDAETASEFLWRFRVDEDGVGAEALEEAGPVRAYILDLIRPGQTGDAFSGTEQRVTSYIFEYGDDREAETAFELLADAWQSDKVSEESTDAEIGDDQILVMGNGQDAVGGAEYQRIDLLFRIERLVAGVSVEKYVGLPNEPALVEALAARQLAWIEDVLRGDSPGLSGLMVRLRIPGENSITDAYTVRDRVRMPQVGETPDEVAEVQALVDQFGIVDQYSIEQQVLGSVLEPADSPLGFFLVRLVSLENEDAASDYLADSVDRLLEGGAEDIEEVEDPPDIGDEVAAFTYRHTRQDGVSFDDYRIYVRVGSDLIALASNTTEELDPEAINELADLQVQCLDGDESCLDPVRVPSELRVSRTQ